MTIALTAQVRTGSGKSSARKIRNAGQCPAVLYGPAVEPLPVQVDPKIFLKILSASGENALIDLSVVDADQKPVETKKVIVREIQYNPFKVLPTHVDFYLVSLDRAIEVSVPIELQGVPAAVTQKIGTLNQQVHELTVECLPDRIPARIVADVSGLALGHSIHVRDLPIPEGVTVVDAPEVTVASVTGIHAEAEVAAPQTESAEPEVIRERKAEETK
jgi:large subunit ribosomal protein L25